MDIEPWFFALMWIGTSALLSVASGWARLARSFRATSPADGDRFWFVSGSMGARGFPVSYGGCLFVAVNRTGFRLSILLPFRLFSPPLFVPWANVESAEIRRFLFVRRAIIRVAGGGPTIALRGRAGDCIAEAWALRRQRVK